MADTDLSQAEVWDDSALLDSWNEAFEEYKVCTRIEALNHLMTDAIQKYHSLAAKGEKVRLNLEKPAPTVENGETATVVEAPLQDESSSELVGQEQVIGVAQPTARSTNVTAAAALPQALLNTGMTIRC